MLRTDRRAEILAAARGLVFEGGLESLSFGALEKRLPFTRGVISYHFGNKHEIVVALLERAVEDIDQGSLSEVALETEPAPRLRSALRAVVNGFLRNPEAAHVLVSFWGRMHGDGEVAATVRRLYTRWRRRSAALVREGQAAGDFRADADADAVGTIIVAVTVGLVIQALQEPGELRVDTCISVAAEGLLADLQIRSG